MKWLLSAGVVLAAGLHVDAAQQLALWTFDSLSGLANGSTVSATAETVAGTPLVTIRNSDIYASGSTGVAYTDALGTPHAATKAIGWSDFKKKNQSVDGQLDISLDATGFSGLTLRFDSKHNNSSDGTENQLEWLYSLNGGSTWSAATLFTVTDDNTWHTKTIALPSAVDGQGSLVIRIEKYAGDSNATEVNNILILDNLEIVGGPSAPLTQTPVITAVNLPPVPSVNPVVLCGSLSDAADAVRSNIVLAVADADTADAQLTATASSSAPAVATASLVRHTSDGQDTFQVILQPVSVGYATITVTVSDPENNRATYEIQYAVSAASDTPEATRYHAGSSDASAAIGLDANWMLVADDENQVIRLYDRTTSGPPCKTFDFSGNLNLAKEADFEAALRIGNRIYWLGSHGNDKTGNAEPTRNTVFSADVSGTGTNTTLTYVSKFSNLKSNLIAWDNANGHGLGAAALGLAASAASGVPCDDPNGFNIEAAAFFNGKVYLGFRTPLENTSARNMALVIPVSNFASVVDAGAGTLTFGAPIFLDLGGRCLRDMATTVTGDVLLLAGPTGDTVSLSFELFVWDGNAASKPRMLSTRINASAVDGGGHPEAIVGPADAIRLGSHVQVIQDNGTTVFYNDGIAGKDLSTRAFAKDRSDDLIIGQQRVVTTSADESNLVPGTGVSLREAVAAACYPDSISFASELSGATLALTNGPLTLAADVVIDASGLTNGVTLSGRHAARVLQLSPGIHATLRSVSIADGYGSSGAGVYNNGGVLELANCTLSGNSATGQGGALYTSTGATIIANSTFANNTANQGGAIAHASGSLTVIHATVAANRADSQAGGLWIAGGTACLSNTIVAANSAPASPNVLGAFTGSGNLTQGLPKLAPLANYGGPSKTMPPLPGSPAIDGASATALTSDQRGAARPRGPLPDIGAVEAFPFSSLPLIDIDGDGIDDRLEAAYGLSTTVNNRMTDSDGDGQPDAVELLNMTDPLDSSSVFRISSITQNPIDPNHLLITFMTFPGLDYELEFAKELGGFAPVPGSRFTATSNSVTIAWPVSPAPGQGFFRISHCLQ